MTSTTGLSATSQDLPAANRSNKPAYIQEKQTAHYNILREKIISVLGKAFGNWVVECCIVKPHIQNRALWYAKEDYKKELRENRVQQLNPNLIENLSEEIENAVVILTKNGKNTLTRAEVQNLITAATKTNLLFCTFFNSKKRSHVCLLEKMVYEHLNSIQLKRRVVPRMSAKELALYKQIQEKRPLPAQEIYQMQLDLVAEDQRDISILKKHISALEQINQDLSENEQMFKKAVESINCEECDITINRSYNNLPPPSPVTITTSENRTVTIPSQVASAVKGGLPAYFITKDMGPATYCPPSKWVKNETAAKDCAYTQVTPIIELVDRIASDFGMDGTTKEGLKNTLMRSIGQEYTTCMAFSWQHTLQAQNDKPTTVGFKPGGDIQSSKTFINYKKREGMVEIIIKLNYPWAVFDPMDPDADPKDYRLRVQHIATLTLELSSDQIVSRPWETVSLNPVILPELGISSEPSEQSEDTTFSDDSSADLSDVSRI